MSNKILKLLLGIIIPTATILAVAFCYNYKVKQNEIAINYRTALDNKLENFYKLTYYELMDVGKKLKLSKLVSNDKFENKGIDLESISICIRIPKEYCSTCIDDYLDQFEELIDTIGINKSLILVNYEEENMIDYMTRRHVKLNGIIFNVRNIDLDVEKLKRPYVLILNKNGQICNIHLTGKDYTERYEMFLKGIPNVINNL